MREDVEHPPGSSRFVPSFSLAAVKRKFLLGSKRNFSLGRDKQTFSQMRLGHDVILSCRYVIETHPGH